MIYQMYWLNQINKYITTLMFKLQSKLLRKSRVAFKLVFDILHNIRNGGFNYFHIVSTRNSKWNDFTIARILWRTLEKSIWRILNFVEALQRKSETTKFDYSFDCQRSFKVCVRHFSMILYLKAFQKRY